jgi:hypothetical protein
MGATIYDLGNVLKAESLAKVDAVMKGIEAKSDQKRQAEMQQEKQMHDEQFDQEERLKQQEWGREDRRQQMINEKDVLVAEIRAAGMGSMADLNNNGQNDYEDALARIQGQQQFRDTMNFKREQEANKTSINKDKNNIQREKIAAENKRSGTDLQVARIEKSKKAVGGKE